MLKTSPSTGHCKAFSLKPVKYKQSNPRQKTFLHHPSTYGDFHHKRIPPPVRELIAAMVNRELTECLDLLEQLFNCDTASALEHLRAIQGGVR
jgi:hypothetical protein